MVVYRNYYLVSICNVLTVSRNCTKLQLCPIHPIQSSCLPMSLVPLRWSSGPGKGRDTFPGYSGSHSSEPFWTSLKSPWDIDHITHLTVVLDKRAHSSKHLEAAEKHVEALRVRQKEQATEDNRSESRSAKFSDSPTRGCYILPWSSLKDKNTDKMPSSHTTSTSYTTYMHHFIHIAFMILPPLRTGTRPYLLHPMLHLATTESHG